MLTKVTGALGQVANTIVEAGGSIVGVRSGTEEPSFTVERKIGDVEIRRYGPRVAAQTAISADEEAARNEGFRRLARYIFGGNTAKTKIAMTAPVSQEQGKGKSEKIAMTAPVAAERGAGGQWVIRFFMPSKHTLKSLPTPNDDRVELVTVPAETVAVLRFSGNYTPQVVATRSKQLMSTLHGAGIEPDGEPVAWFYDPPWTIPFRRRNEVAITLP